MLIKIKHRQYKPIIIAAALLMVLVGLIYALSNNTTPNNLAGDKNVTLTQQFDCKVGDASGKDSVLCLEDLGFSFEVPQELAGKIERSSTPEQSTKLDESGENSEFIPAEKTYTATLKDQNTTFFYSIASYPEHKMYITNSTDEGSYYYSPEQGTFVNSITGGTIDTLQNYKVNNVNQVKVFATDLKGESVDLSQNIFTVREKLIVVKVRAQQSVSDDAEKSDMNLSSAVRSLLNSTIKIDMQ